MCNFFGIADLKNHAAFYENLASIYVVWMPVLFHHAICPFAKCLVGIYIVPHIELEARDSVDKSTDMINAPMQFH